MWLFGYVKIKNKLFECAEKSFQNLKSSIENEQRETREEYFSQLTTEEKQNISVYNNVVMTPKEYLDYIYNNSDFKEYLKYCLAIKKVEKKMALMFLITLVAVFGLAALPIIIIKNVTLAMILAAVILVVSYFLMLRGPSSRSYDGFYAQTMSDLLFSILTGYRFKELNNETTTQNSTNTQNTNNRRFRNKLDDIYYSNRKLVTLDKLKSSFKPEFDHFKEKDTMLYRNSDSAGGMCDLEIIKKVEKKNSSTGEITTDFETILNGFYVRNEFKSTSDYLYGCVVEIREDDNFKSRLLEDTMNSIYHSEKDFSFNSEELNKALDCKIDTLGKTIRKVFHAAGDMVTNALGIDGSDHTAEDAMDPIILLNHVMTPALEEHLLFLRKRYNSFNMNIADDYISFNVNMRYSLFQKITSKDVTSNEYKRNNQDVKFIEPQVYDNKDFEYFRIFPMLEKIFFMHYINLLHRFAVKNNEVTRVELDIMERYEKEIYEVMNEKYSDFKKLYQDDLKSNLEMADSIIEDVKNNL